MDEPFYEGLEGMVHDLVDTFTCCLEGSQAKEPTKLPVK